MSHLLHGLLVALGVACLASFGWAMRYLFTLPDGKTIQIRRFSLTATVCGAIHLATLFFSRGPSPLLAGMAVGCYSLALVVFWWSAAVTLRRRLSFAFSSDSPHHLCQEGPYRWVRHPFYAAYLTTWVAGVLATHQVWLVITVFVMYQLYANAARGEEEKFATSPLATEYVEYTARTGRFLPRLF